MFGMSVVSDLRGGVEEPDQPVEAGQRAAGQHLGDQGADERLLALDPADVAAVADAVAHPHVGERLLAVEGAGAGRDGDAVLGGVDVLGHADLDAVDGVDHVLEAAEVDDDVVVDPDPGDLLELLHGARRAAVGVRRVPHLRRAARDDSSRPRPRSRVGRRASRAGSRRRTPTAGPPRGGTACVVSEPPPASPSMLQPLQSRESEPITRMLSGCLRLVDLDLLRPVAQLARRRPDDVEVAVEVAVQERHRQPAHHRQRQQRRQRGPWPRCASGGPGHAACRGR